MNIYKHVNNLQTEDTLVLKGYQKKLKTMKKKYFAIYKDISNARLEYYDSERKYKTGMPPKRVIKLRNCYNINRRLDTKYEYVIALSIKDGGFGIVFETESEMLKWLEVLISLQRSENASEMTHPQFDHVWQVTVERRGLAEEKCLIGNYHVGLSSNALTFLRIGAEKTALGEIRMPKVEFLLRTIRRCGDSQCYFYMEVGRQSIIGPGEFWMQTEDLLTARNMHKMILSAMSTKSELSMEPMRKRSSSANEASKPINVLQKRQAQTENKINSSPQAGFGRERCDSLPTRNRTSSDSSTHNLTATSALSVRNYSMSGLRPHSYQRHSNSPPMNTTAGCSESEESSVSIDEPDDNGSFMSYRFTSRSSEGVIPEENTDELMGVDSKINISKEALNNDLKCDSLTPSETNESYLSMAPINTYKENRNKLTDDSRYVPSIMEFPEYNLDNASKNTTNDADLQFERPTRAYSIGSKTEHIKFNKRTANLNDFEQNSTRVRAFSVGSRAKIPRCDLQRSVLFPKSLMEHSCNSNNNLCPFNDPCTPHPTSNATKNSEKKSTSAPLLIHKSQNSVDNNSDLMLLDFSKSSNNTNNRIYPSQAQMKSQIFKNFGNSNQQQPVRLQENTLLHVTIPKKDEEDMKTSKSFTPIIETLTPPPQTNQQQTDTGYLEMKPVGDSLSKNTPTKLLKDSSNLFSVSSALIVSSTPRKSGYNTASLIENKKQLKPQQIRQTTTTAAVLVKRSNQNDLDIFDNIMKHDTNKIETSPIDTYDKDDNMKEKLMEKESTNKLISNIPNKNELIVKDQNSLDILSTKYAQMKIDSKTPSPPPLLSTCQSIIKQQIFDNNSSKDDYINIIQKNNEQISANLKNQLLKVKDGRENLKLTHSISDEDNKYIDSTIVRKCMPMSKETGYEILQIKSDSSLQSHKSLNRYTSNRKDKQYCQQNQCRPRSTNSSVTALCGCTSSSMSCLNNIQVNSTTNAATTNPTTNTAAKADQLNTSLNCKVNNASSTTNPTSTTVTITNSTTTSPLNVISRPPSVSSEHDLHYATLDLPKSSSDVSVKLNKIEISNGSSPVAADINIVSNLYAKIDFDVSDSSSLKNLNN